MHGHVSMIEQPFLLLTMTHHILATENNDNFGLGICLVTRKSGFVVSDRIGLYPVCVALDTG